MIKGALAGDSLQQPLALLPIGQIRREKALEYPPMIGHQQVYRIGAGRRLNGFRRPLCPILQENARIVRQEGCAPPLVN